MNHRLRGIALALGVLAVSGISAAPALADGGEDAPWDRTFKGHEMWLTSIDEGLKTSTELSKPLLIDLYSRG
jgi:hypothetical protein